MKMGRMFVIEMRGYSERRDEELGRIRMLTDTTGDGVFDKSTIYLDKLKWPTAVICYKGGIFRGSHTGYLLRQRYQRRWNCR